MRIDDPYDNPRNTPGNINKCMSERKDIAERIVRGAKTVRFWAKKEALAILNKRKAKDA